MSERKIYPLNPIFETTTSDGRRAWVAFYTPDNRYVWRGLVEGMIIGAATWTPSGGYGDGFPEGQDLTSVPEVPPEAREPKPGEIWRESSTRPAMVLEWRGDYYRCLVPICGDYHVWPLKREELKSPWPADEPHYFERLIDVIRGAET